jgi:hypothetical protein
MKVDVLLDVDSKDPHFPLFQELGKTLKFKERSVIDVDCEDADFSAPFVRLQLGAPENRRGLILWIHAHRVIFAYAQAGEKKIGFLSS